MVSRPSSVSRLFLQVAEPPRKSFQADQFDHIEVHSLEFAPELLRLVKVRRREPVRTIVGIAMLTLCQVPLDNPSELRIEEEAAGQTIEE